MAQDLIEPISGTMPGPLARPFDNAMSSLPTLWGRLMGGPRTGRHVVEAAIAEAETLNAALLDEVRTAGQLATPAELKTFLRMLVSAWPNASQNDLAGYGMQLSKDVEDHRPSKHALTEAARTLRRTAKFLPSISEVLDAITAADKPMLAILRTVDRIPEALEHARRELAEMNRGADRRTTQRGEPAHD